MSGDDTRTVGQLAGDLFFAAVQLDRIDCPITAEHLRHLAKVLDGIDPDTPLANLVALQRGDLVMRWSETDGDFIVVRGAVARQEAQP